jgi:outer membrane protein TolC
MLDNSITLRGIGFAALALGAGRPLAAQPDPLGHLVREAWANNRTLQQTRLAVREHEAGVRQARARYFPTLGPNRAGAWT